MTYFLAPGELSEGESIVLEGEEAQHLLKSRRMRAGERFALQDARGWRFWAELVQAEPKPAEPVQGNRGGARVRVHGSAPIPALPDPPVRLWLASVKDKAAEQVVQKATELGVAELHVFTAQHSTVAHAELAVARTVQRWTRIAVEACKQCDRQAPPPLRVWPSLAALLVAGVHTGSGWLLDREGAPPALAPSSASGLGGGVTVLVGPEGGLTPEEIAAACAAGFTRVRLGPLTLRSETAAIAGCAVAVQVGR
jgi:16S rRNA (uracil1498-N3)-methyltransferase